MTDQPRFDHRLLRLNVGFLLKEGPGYTREFTIEQTAPLEIEDLTVDRLSGALRMTRVRQGIVMQGDLDAHTAVECVRCLSWFSLPCQITLSDLFVYPPPPQSDGDNLYIVDDGGFIDLSPIVREEGILSIPIQALCSPNCKGLCANCGHNLNEGECGCSPEPDEEQFGAVHATLRGAGI